MLPPLLLLHNDRPLYVQVVVLVLEDLKQRWVLTPVDPDSLELVSEVLFDGELLEGRALHDDVVLTLEHETVYHEVLTLEQV